VQLAVARHEGHDRCRYMRSSGSLRSSAPCSEPRWIRASGRRRWQLRIRHHIGHGTYTAHVRAVDRTHNFELFTRRTHGPRRNFLKFRIR
jgi:hypothetical protein